MLSFKVIFSWIFEFNFTFFKSGSNIFSFLYYVLAVLNDLTSNDSYFLLLPEGIKCPVGTFIKLLLGTFKKDVSTFACGDRTSSFAVSLAVYDFFFTQNYYASFLIFSAFLIASFDFSRFFLLISSIFLFQLSSSILISFSMLY